jgi:hypothetical protein
MADWYGAGWLAGPAAARNVGSEKRERRWSCCCCSVGWPDPKKGSPTRCDMGIYAFGKAAGEPRMTPSVTYGAKRWARAVQSRRVTGWCAMSTIQHTLREERLELHLLARHHLRVERQAGRHRPKGRGIQLPR